MVNILRPTRYYMIFRGLVVAMCICFAAGAADAAEQSLGDTLKKIFSTPTPTPHRKKKTTASPKKSPTPVPASSPSPKKKSSPGSGESPSAMPRISSKKKKPSAAQEESPSPSASASSHRKKKASPTPAPEETPSPSATPGASPHRKRKGSPTPAELESPSPGSAESPIATPSPPKKAHAENATLLPNQIKGFENYPLKVQKLLTSALELTTRNLDYKYGWADPSAGGMDCSGFVYYVLKQNDVTDVPRDSAEQYVWLRRSGKFEPVISRKEN